MSIAPMDVLDVGSSHTSKHFALSERVLLTDQRGMRSLSLALPPLDWNQLTQDLLGKIHRGEPILICTGFPVNGFPETDGPLGSLLLASALHQLGAKVTIVSMPAVISSIEGLHAVETESIACGTTSKPVEGIAITVEICGRVADGSYRNMRGHDISALAPWFESVIGHQAFISIGDGGNEFGFGSAPAAWHQKFNVLPPVSQCQYLIPAEVSNWGALALLAALQRLTKENLLPTPQAYQALLGELARRGMVDGFSGVAMPTEDGKEIGAATPIIEALMLWANTTSP